MFFQSKLSGACLNCWADPLTLDVELLCKNKKQKGSTEARPLRLRYLSQFFPMEENINCLENEVLCVSLRTFHLWGGLVFIMDDHDNFHNWMMTLNNMFPCWRMIRYFSHWVGEFLSLS